MVTAAVLAPSATSSSSCSSFTNELIGSSGSIEPMGRVVVIAMSEMDEEAVADEEEVEEVEEIDEVEATFEPLETIEIDEIDE